MLYHPYNNISLDDRVVRDATVTQSSSRRYRTAAVQKQLEALHGSRAQARDDRKGWNSPSLVRFLTCCVGVVSCHILYIFDIYICVCIILFDGVVFFQYVFPRVLFPCVYTKSLLVIFSTATHPMIFFGSFFIPLGSNPSLMVPLKYDPPIGCAS